jgi:hypothetical protein
MLSSRKLGIGGGAMTLAVAMTGIAVAATSSRSSTIHGCVGRHGELRVATRCASGERSLTWNKAGRTGKTGPAGPSKGYATTTQVGFGLSDDKTLLTLTLPAGNYELAASIELSNNETSQVTVSCGVQDSPTQDDSYTGIATAGVPFGGGVIPGAGSVAVTSTVTLTKTTPVWVFCTGPSDVDADGNFQAIKVGSLSATTFP